MLFVVCLYSRRFARMFDRTPAPSTADAHLADTSGWHITAASPVNISKRLDEPVSHFLGAKDGWRSQSSRPTRRTRRQVP